MKKLLLLLLIYVTSLSAFSQKIEGTWYDVSNPSSTFILHLQKENNALKGTYDITSTRQNVLHAPIDNINQKEDSLIFQYSSNGQPLTFKGAFVFSPDTITGYVTAKEGVMYPMIFSRQPLDVDYTIHREKPVFSHQDSLRGSVTKERAWWDLTYYDLDIKVNFKDSTIAGSNTIRYKVLKPYQTLQIDLQQPMKITKITEAGKAIDFHQDGYAYFVELQKPQKTGDVNEIIVYYEGRPHQAVRPPWDGGFTWSQDSKGKPWIATSCQGDGASMWWPNKDHMYDEVDSMKISINVPSNLVAVANGRLIGTEKAKGHTKTYHWYVSNPINNYGVNVNIADYAHFSEVYQGEKGPLTCDYYVLKENLEKAKKHFKEVPRMLEAFEHWFGPYPFYEDGYKLVGVPYLGMEHQSSVTYGNHYQNGYYGRNWTNTEWEQKFDFIIVHESGHEWFANNITYKDIADMWVHEGFTSYSESLFIEYFYGKEAAQEYLRGIRNSIANDKPMVGNYDVNETNHTGDVYFRGNNMLNTLRQIIDNDEKWRSILRGLNKEYYHQTVTTEQIENYINDHTEWDLQPFFNQYLRTVMVPTLEYYFEDNKVVYRWINAIPEFDMPVRVFIDGKAKWLYPKTIWTKEYLGQKGSTLKVDESFYVASFDNGK